MKNTMNNKLILAFLASAAFLFTSCQEIIFATIRDEVELGDAQISGDINSIVRCNLGGTEYLFTENGNIWQKNVSAIDAGQYSGEWSKSSKPDLVIYKLAADSTYLYAVGYNYEADDTEGEMVVSEQGLYCTSDGTTWTAVTIDGVSSIDKDTPINLFCTNAPIASNRKAYITYDSIVYELSGTSTTAIYDSTNSIDGGNGLSSSTASAAYFGGNVYFTSCDAMATNEISSQYGNTETDAAYMYYASGDNFYYTDGSTSATGDFTTLTSTLYWKKYDLSCGSIYSIAVTKDSILLGTSDGIEKVTNTDGVPGSGTASFSTNADSTLSSYYEVWNVIALDQGTNEAGGDLYGTTIFSGSSSSTSATFSNVGLWAYYPGRGNWNRE